jgi:hypothetical protein
MVINNDILELKHVKLGIKIDYQQTYLNILYESAFIRQHLLTWRQGNLEVMSEKLRCI